MCIHHKYSSLKFLSSTHLHKSKDANTSDCDQSQDGVLGAISAHVADRDEDEAHQDVCDAKHDDEQAEQVPARLEVHPAHRNALKQQKAIMETFRINDSNRSMIQ